MSIELHPRFGLEGFPRIRDWEGEGDQEPQETSCLCLKMLCAYISAVIWVYLYIPCMDIYLCFSSLGQYSMHFELAFRNLIFEKLLLHSK